MNLDGWFCWLLENYVYALPEPPPRRRIKPMEVLCVGLPRSGTESLQQALMKLGYDYTYHGWDIIYEEPNYGQQWARLSRKKWFGSPGGAPNITSVDFDAIIGHCVAVTDVAAAGFAAELIAAYPDAKVILNRRKDLESWHRSTMKTLLHVSDNKMHAFGSFLTRKGFWTRHFFVRFAWPGIFRALDGSPQTGIISNGIWAHEEHCNMVRGMVPKDRLLEWAIEDGWGPLCGFLRKPIPEEPFPHVNAGGGWLAHEEKMASRDEKDAARNILLALASLVVGLGMLVLAFWRHR